MLAVMRTHPYPLGLEPTVAFRKRQSPGRSLETRCQIYATLTSTICSVRMCQPWNPISCFKNSVTAW